MGVRTTDFYLNLDRLEALSAVERDRGRWQARMEGPVARLEPLQQEALLESCWSLTQPDPQKPPGPNERTVLLASRLPAGTDPGLVRAWRYGRAIQFVQNWYPAFPWTDAGIDQLRRILENGDPGANNTEPSGLLALRLQAALVGRETGEVPLLEIAAFYGASEHVLASSLAKWQLYLLAFRLMLLQKGYVQVLFGPLEAVWIDGRRSRKPPIRERPASEESLGAWLDELTSMLVEVGRWAEDAWKRAAIRAPRSSLQETILTLAHREGRVTAGEILRATRTNRNTVKDNLARMVREGVLHKQGLKRGTIYTPV